MLTTRGDVMRHDLPRVGVVDVGLGNVASVHNMFRRAGLLSVGVSKADDLVGVRGVVLPGVGAFDAGMARLTAHDLVTPLRDLAASPTPLLGICLGMQLLCADSEEGSQRGLEVFPTSVRSLAHDRPDARLPHVGWAVTSSLRENPLMPVDEPNRFYFVHSFGVDASSAAAVATATFDDVPFAAAIGDGTNFGVQFHPEKSHGFGKRLLSRFWESLCCSTV